MLDNVPEWARERGLDDRTFDILESIVLNPENKQQLLDKVEYEEACCIQQALEYAQDQGLLQS